MHQATTMQESQQYTEGIEQAKNGNMVIGFVKLKSPHPPHWFLLLCTEGMGRKVSAFYRHLSNLIAAKKQLYIYSTSMA